MKELSLPPGSDRAWARLLRRPKYLLPIAGRTLIDRTIENFGCRVSEIVIIRGHKGHMINVPDVTYVKNFDFQNNNILHSLMHARDHLQARFGQLFRYLGGTLVHQKLIETDGDVVISVDRDWMPITIMRRPTQYRKPRTFITRPTNGYRNR